MSRTDARLVIRADNQTDHAFAQVESNLDRMRGLATSFGAALGGVAATGGALVASLAATTLQLAQQGRELEQNALKAGVSVEEMQALQYATKQYNVSGEQFADMIKDANEKIGDFISTGGGELKDFFEIVAPAAGLAAQELANLSGPAVLVRFKQALDDANLSAKEQVAYLEMISNDATTLAPLLANGANELERFATEYRELNVALSQSDISALAQMSRDLEKVQAQLLASGKKGVASLSDEVSWFSDNFTRSWASMGESFSRWDTLFEGLDSRTDAIGGIWTLLTDGLLGGEELIQRREAKAQLQGEALAQHYLQGYIARMTGADVLLSVPELPAPARPNVPVPFAANVPLEIGQTTAESWEAEQAALQTMIQLRQQASQAGLDSEAKLVAQRDLQLAQLQALADAHPHLAGEVASAQAAITGAYERQQAALEKAATEQEKLEQAAIDRQIETLAASLRTQSEMVQANYDDTLSKLQELHEAGHLSEARYLDLRASAQRRFYDDMAEAAEDAAKENATWQENLLRQLQDSQEGVGDLFEDMVSRFSEGMGQAFESALFDSEDLGDAVSGVFENMGRAMVAFFGEWAAQRMMQWVLEKTLMAGESAGYVANVSGRGLAETQLGALNAAASTAAIPIIGPALAPAAALAFQAFGAGLTAAAATAAGTAIAGVAHGGLDFVQKEATYLLDHGERVLSPRQNQDLTEYLRGGGSSRRGGDVINFHVNGTNDAAIVRGIDRTMRKRNKRRDNAVASAAFRGNLNRGKKRYVN